MASELDARIAVVPKADLARHFPASRMAGSGFWSATNGCVGHRGNEFALSALGCL